MHDGLIARGKKKACRPGFAMYFARLTLMACKLGKTDEGGVRLPQKFSVPQDTNVQAQTPVHDVYSDRIPIRAHLL
jgi:hypothetical protein